MTLDLLAPSRGLALPSLTGIPVQMSWGGDTATTLRVLIRELLRAKTFTPRGGPVSGDDPLSMIATGIARLVGMQPDPSSYGMTVRSVPRVGAAVLVTIYSSQYAAWGGVRAALAAHDPRYARWFYRALHRAAGSLGPMYDYAAAAVQHEYRLEVMQDDMPEEPSEAGEDAAADGAAADAMAEWQTTTTALAADAAALTAQHADLMLRGRCPSESRGTSRRRWPVALRNAVEATRRLDRAGRTFRAAMRALPAKEAERHVVDAYDAYAPAWPLVLADAPYDLVETAFDEEAAGFHEVEHAPNVIIPLDTRSPRGMRRGFDALRALGALLRAFGAWRSAMEAFPQTADGAIGAPGASATPSHAE